MTIGIKINDVQFNYGAIEILKGVSLEIEPGEVVGIIGPNGSGKSTLLKTIAAALKPFSGEIFFGEQKLFEIKPKKLAQRLAVVPQDTVVNFNFSVWEIVLMGRTPHQGRFATESAEDLAIAEEAMKLTNTWDFRDKSVTALSGGERQRVILARALTQKPEVLLLDEPIANLDINHQIEVLGLIKRLNERDKLTSVVVLHDLNLAARYCEKLVLIKGGNIFAIGSPREVITEANIKEVYGSRPLISPHPLSGVPQITIIESSPFMDTEVESEKRKKSVHFIGGGGIATPAIKELVRRGFRVSVGVLNAGDTDWQTAKALELETAVEDPFSPISKEAYHKNIELIKRADMVVLMPIPFGTGNVLNLAVLKDSLSLGKKTYAIDFDNIVNRDFSMGEATELAKELMSRGVVNLDSLEELWNRSEKSGQ